MWTMCTLEESGALQNNSMALESQKPSKNCDLPFAIVMAD